MSRIPGLRHLPEPTFFTDDDAWVSLDAVVREVCADLGGGVSPMVCKATIQVARHAMQAIDRVDVGQVAAEVCQQLRPERIVVTPIVVHAILLAYANVVAGLGVVQITEGWDWHP